MAGLFEPYSLKGVTLRNRVVVSPMSQYMATFINRRAKTPGWSPLKSRIRPIRIMTGMNESLPSAMPPIPPPGIWMAMAVSSRSSATMPG